MTTKAMEGEVLLNVLIKLELTNGNTGRGSKWFKSNQVRQDIESLLILSRLRRQPFPDPVRVHVTRVLGKDDRLWDSSSIGRGNYKELEDALVAVGWFKDDGPKWIVETRFYQDASRRYDGPAVMIVVEKVELGKGLTK